MVFANWNGAPALMLENGSLCPKVDLRQTERWQMSRGHQPLKRDALLIVLGKRTTDAKPADRAPLQYD
jgi:hypothetical protein